MALKSTIVRAQLAVADIDRGYYADHAVTIAQHPSETDERMMVRLLAFALHADARLEFGRGLSTDDELERIAALLQGKYAVMNLIPWNAVEGLGFERPTSARLAALALALNRRGILTKLRNSAGQDVDAGCGQLRARTLPLQRVSGPHARVPTTVQPAWR